MERLVRIRKISEKAHRRIINCEDDSILAFFEGRCGEESSGKTNATLRAVWPQVRKLILTQPIQICK
jgi:hypothetical protein